MTNMVLKSLHISEDKILEVEPLRSRPHACVILIESSKLVSYRGCGMFISTGSI